MKQLMWGLLLLSITSTTSYGQYVECCDVAPPTVINYSPVVRQVNSDGYRFTIVNQGVEKSRFYIKAKYQGQFYLVPVINGNMPEITFHTAEYLTLDYGKKISYTNAFGGEYVNYIPNTESKVNGNKVPGGVKNFDQPKTVRGTTSGVHRVDDREIDDLFKKK